MSGSVWCSKCLKINKFHYLSKREDKSCNYLENICKKMRGLYKYLHFGELFIYWDLLIIDHIGLLYESWVSVNNGNANK